MILGSLPLAAQPTTKVTINAVFPPLSYMPIPGMQYASDFSQYVLTSPLVDGVSAPLLWSMVDKGPGTSGKQYDWSEYDAAIQPYIAHGKKVNVLVWSISESGVNDGNSANHATPAYVMQSAASVVCSGFPGDGTQSGRYPVVWDPNFETNYEKFITEVLKHYHGDPHIGYIRFGLFGGAAAHPYCETELTPFLPSGKSFTDACQDFGSQILSYVRSQGPTFPVIAPFAAYNSQLSWADAEAEAGIANGFGLGYQGLRASDISTYPVCGGDWCNLFSTYAGVTPPPLFELQTVGQSDPSGTCTPSCFDGDHQKDTGALPPLISFAVSHDVKALEIYTNDLLLALDPNYPGYSEYHTLYQKALSAAHSGEGLPSRCRR